jgi:hypothetical protein
LTAASDTDTKEVASLAYAYKGKPYCLDSVLSAIFELKQWLPTSRENTVAFILTRDLNDKIASSLFR